MTLVAWKMGSSDCDEIEGIGLTLNVAGDRMSMPDLEGSQYTASPNEATHKTCLVFNGI
jgi:hypothetical protein